MSDASGGVRHFLITLPDRCWKNNLAKVLNLRKVKPIGLNALRSLWHSLLDFTYPACCVLCQASLTEEETIVCRICLDSLPRLDESFISGEHFSKQLGDKPWFSGSLALFSYNETLHKVIHLFKYKGYHSLARPLGEELGYLLRDTVLPENALLVPVPLHKRRLLERGYNQAHLLADGAAAVCGLPCSALLQRTRYTLPQAKQSKSGRARNLAGAFRVLQPASVQGAAVILVDDLITTGHTMNECAKTLMLAGCSRVFCATLIRV